MSKLYGNRDICRLDEAGGYYCKHVEAMTSEGLRSKMQIAAELAYRDYQIQVLVNQLECYGDKPDWEGYLLDKMTMEAE